MRDLHVHRRAEGAEALTSPKTILTRLKPAAPRAVLLLAAGLLWTAVGAMLVFLAARWIVSTGFVPGVFAAATGVLAAAFAWRMLFRKIAHRNIDRIRAGGEWACVFSFQNFRSWCLVGVMVALGLLLRHSRLPRIVLGTVYLAIGGALFLASLAYYRLLLRRAA